MYPGALTCPSHTWFIQKKKRGWRFDAEERRPSVMRQPGGLRVYDDESYGVSMQ